MNINMEYASVPETQNTSAAILPLPADAIAQIKSSTNITNLNDVALGLIENSLDAQATKINISIDFRRGGCTVEDNGLGILPSEFREHGGLGRMYHTSKHEDNSRYDTHGGQGTFLASVGALSLLTITSRHFQHYSNNTLTLHRAKPISRLTPASAQHGIHSSEAHGTRVSVRDLFGNMPVRVKQRAINAEESFEAEKQWRALKVGTVGLLLPWNSQILTRVTDAENPTRTLCINTSLNFASNALSERNLNTLNKKTSGFDQGTVLSILSQAKIIPMDTKDSWIPVSASTQSVTVKGLISLEPAPNRIAQFMSIGITPCLGQNRHNELFETINRIFSQSSFGNVDEEDDLDDSELKRRQHDRRYKQDGFTNKRIRGGRKGIDRWPKFYFHIELKTGNEAQMLSGLSDMRLQSIMNVLESLAIGWLEANNFSPKQPRNKKARVEDGKAQTARIRQPLTVLQPASSSQSRPRSDSFQQTSSSLSPTTFQARIGRTNDQTLKEIQSGVATDLFAATSSTPFTDWSRIKSARPQLYEKIWQCKTPPPKQNVTSEARPAEMNDAVDNPRTINVEAVTANQFGHGNGTSDMIDLQETRVGRFNSTEGDQIIDWVDPETQHKHRINARTGMVVPEESHRISSEIAQTHRDVAATDTRMSSFGRPLLLQRRKDALSTTHDVRTSTAPTSPWLPKFLQTWQNPTFVNQQEHAIDIAHWGGIGKRAYGLHDHHQIGPRADSFPSAGFLGTNRLFKSALPYAQVISQVDDKFILMKLPSLPSPGIQELDRTEQLLVLVDQHAASERCILEELLQELCSPAQGEALVRSKLGFTSAVVSCPIDKPLHFQVPLQEEALFRAHAEHFANWGILYDLTLSTSDPARLSILSLPPGISERCKAEPRLLMDLLRGEIHSLAESSLPRIRTLEPSAPDSKHAWLKRIGSCPAGLLQLLNSRSCRSAVMFNDELTLEQCQTLVDKVARCAFPFMCAHGRNSMVPLVSLDGGENDGKGSIEGGFGEVENRRQGFGDAYRKWMKKRRQG